MISKTLAAVLCGFGLVALFSLAGCGKSTSNSDNRESENVSAAKDPDQSQSASREKIRSVNNLKQIVLALQNCESAYGKLPSPGLPESIKSEPFNSMTMWSWRVQLLPFIEQGSLYNEILKANQRAIPDNLTHSAIGVFQNPLDRDKQPYKTNYRVFVGNGAAFEYGKGVSILEFTDGIANTILVVEVAEPVDWSKVDELAYDPKKPLPKLGIFAGGFHAAMGDGIIRWIPADTDEKLIRAMITRNGGEKITLPGRVAP